MYHGKLLANKPIVVFIGTYPPRGCGIATFTQDLLRASRQLLLANVTCKVAAVNQSRLDSFVYPAEVSWQISQDEKQDYLALAEKMNGNPLVMGVVLQHEYGIYGGEAGEYILAFLEQLKKPCLVTLHTVLPNPDQKMREVTTGIIKYASVIVVLTHNSREILEQTYSGATGKVSVIPHGVHDTPFSNPAPWKQKLRLADAMVLSTFGFLSRGKGIEYVLRALPSVVKSFPSVQYLILGETHPEVRRQEGELYRQELVSLVAELGIKSHVKFYDQYLDLAQVIGFLKATDIYVSSSINPNQAVSGTLSYALGTGRAVISTQFAQAREIVTDDIGRLVPFRDSSALAAAIINLLSDEQQLQEMYAHAYQVTRSMLWQQVAQEYSVLLSQAVLPPINLRHLKAMTDEFGMFQFAQGSVPDQRHGYTLDDNARALIVCSQLQLTKYIDIYLGFIEKCQQADGSFVNYLNAREKLPSQQNQTEDLSDAYSRALWAVNEVMTNLQLPAHLRRRATRIFLMALPNVNHNHHLRTQAMLIKAFSGAQLVLPKYRRQLLTLIDQLAEVLSAALVASSDGSWHWFADHLSYNNAVLSESLLVAGHILQNNHYVAQGKSSLQFLISKTFSDSMYVPVGQSAWYFKHQKRSCFDQQPEDPCAMVLALTTAYSLLSDESYKNLAQRCFSWFLGNNSLHTNLYDFHTGGCYDGLHPDRVNLNQGAESLLSYLLARLAMTKLRGYEN